jgi:hypothetical protein
MQGSVLNTAGHIAAHTISTATAHLMQRQFRFNGWAQKVLMGNGTVPCDLWSTPTADGIFTLEVSSNGFISVDAYDLASVAISETIFDTSTTPASQVRAVTFRCPIGVRDLDKIIYLHNTDPCENVVTDGWETDLQLPPVRVYIVNQSEDNPAQDISVAGPAYYVVNGGELRYIIIKRGKIVGISN